MSALDVSLLSKAELLKELDEVIQQIKTAEESDPAVILYKQMCQDATDLTDALKQYVSTDGAFQSRYVAFQQVKQNVVDWKAVCEHLYKTGRLEDQDIIPFKKEKDIVRAMKVKEGSSDMEVNS